MLTEFSIGNYQAFSTPQRVPLKPITLIFGPNSAGKSALLRSLLVARHAILNGKLSKSEGSGERHPGFYADIVRNGNSNPILFGFTVQPDGKSREEALELGLAWKENLGGVETVALSLRQRQSEVVTYLANGDSKHLQVKNFGEELRQRMTSARHESDTEGKGDDLVHRSIKNRLSLQKNVSLPGSDVDHFRNEEDEADILRHIEESCKNGKILDLALVAWMRSIKTTDDSFKSAITTQIKAVGTSLRDALSNLIYHGPIRPICDEITKARKSEPGMMEWWNLAADPKLLAKVNDWLASDIFRTKYRLDFERLFPDSSLKQVLQYLSEKRSIGELLEAAFEAKLNSDEQFYESVIDPVAFDMEQHLEEENEDEDERKAVARRHAHDAVIDESWERGRDHFNSLLDDSGTDEIEAFVIGGVNQKLADLRGKLEAVRQRDVTTSGGFDSAKICFRGFGSENDVSPSNMGIGFSQMMPLVASAFGAENSLIAIEQPELHVHPALQTELADLFIQSAKERGNRFLIETHSEHLILRVMKRIRQTFEDKVPEGKRRITPDDVCVLYVETGENGSIVREMPLNERGELVKGWPGGFFEEAMNEMFEP
jgi:hypothetical protein